MVELSQEFGALGHCLGMAVDASQVGDRRTFDPEETMADPETDVTDEMEPALQQQVVHLRDRT